MWPVVSRSFSSFIILKILRGIFIFFKKKNPPSFRTNVAQPKNLLSFKSCSSKWKRGSRLRTFNKLRHFPFKCHFDFESSGFALLIQMAILKSLFLFASPLHSPLLTKFCLYALDFWGPTLAYKFLRVILCGVVCPSRHYLRNSVQT